LHEAHQASSFEKCFDVPIGAETVHYPPSYDDGNGAKCPIVVDLSLDQSHGPTLPIPWIPLYHNKDDNMLLFINILRIE
jgi:hypothetical protein